MHPVYGKTPSLKREPTRHWWATVEYTASTGKVTRQKVLTNAILATFGSLCMPGRIQYREDREAGTYGAYVDVYCLKAFRKDGTMLVKGSIRWAVDYDEYRLCSGRP